MICATGLLEMPRSHSCKTIHGARLLQGDKEENGAENDGNRRQGFEEPGDDSRSKERKSCAKIDETDNKSEGSREEERYCRGQRIWFRHQHDENRDRQSGEEKLDHA
jgi:hypothetical protein